MYEIHAESSIVHLAHIDQSCSSQNTTTKKPKRLAPKIGEFD